MTLTKKTCGIISLVVVLILTMATFSANAQTTTNAVTNSTEGHTMIIAPYPPTIDANNIQNAIFSTSFNSGNIYDDAGTLMIDLNVYENVIYDAVELSMLNLGDIIRFPDEDVVVTSFENNGDININGGYAAGGRTLTSVGGGAFAEITASQNPVLLNVGVASLPVEQNFVLADHNGTGGVTRLFAGDLFDVMKTNRMFPEFRTTARVENGYIIEIMCK